MRLGELSGGHCQVSHVHASTANELVIDRTHVDRRSWLRHLRCWLFTCNTDNYSYSCEILDSRSGRLYVSTCTRCGHTSL